MAKITPDLNQKTVAHSAVPCWQATVLTLSGNVLDHWNILCRKSLNAGIWSLKKLDIREFARDKHRTVDDAPLGGGVGMVLKPDVGSALNAVKDCPGPGVYLSPRGRVLDQVLVRSGLQRVRCFYVGAMKGLIAGSRLS